MALSIPILTDTKGVKGPPQGQWTVADWERLPNDGNRYEVIDGVLYVSVVPSVFHQRIVGQLLRAVAVPMDERRTAYANHYVAVFMPGCDPVIPDFHLIQRERAGIIQRYVQGVPDLIIEVLFPGSADYDEDVKLHAYAKAGVPEYGVIDPSARQLRLYALEQPGQYGEPRRFDAGDVAAFTCAPGITFEVGRLFEGSPDTTV